jgi:dolichyl-diphosphooligosaccharide--protein glycosyltransferase
MFHPLIGGSDMQEKNPEDDDFDIDFSWIKKLFRKKTKQRAEELEKKAEQVKDKIGERKKESPDSKDELDREEAKIEKAEKSTQKIEKKAEQADMATEKVEKTLDKQEEIIDDVEEEVEEEIDWSKVKDSVKSVWSKGKTALSKSESEEEDIKVDWNRAGQLLKKYNVLLIILIPLIVSIYLRSMPVSLPSTDSWAEQSVDNVVISQIKNNINQQYPNLPDANKDQLVNEEYKKFREQNRDQYDSQVRGTSDFFKSRLRDDNDQTYLIAIDPWFWYRHARNIINNGHPGDEIKDGTQWDNHMLAPIGRAVPADKFHAYLGAYSYKIFRIFNKDLELLTVMFLLPMIITVLGVIPAFFIARRYGGNFGGLIAGLIVALHPNVMTRTTAGFSDTDGYNVLFPLLIAWLFISALESKDRKQLLIYTILAGFATGLYSFAWSGWWHIFDFLIIASVCFLIYLLFINRTTLKTNLLGILKNSNIKRTLSILVLFILVTGISVTLFTNFYNFKSGFISPFGFTLIKSVGVESAYPNVFTTVAEQNEVDLPGIVNQLGGKFLFFAALLGIMISLWSKNNKRLHEILFLSGSALYYLIGINYITTDPKLFVLMIALPIAAKILWAMYNKDTTIDIKYSIILIIWLIATVYASTKGIRWILLGVAPLAIAVGITFGTALKSGIRYMHKEFNIHKIITSIVLIVAMLLLIGIAPLPPFCKYGLCESGRNVAFHEVPSMNDAWYNSLDRINKEAAPDAIINSWWDFGHWFKAIGDRAVTFDGTTQNTPMAHFVGHALLTSNEPLAVGTLRMLDCASDQAASFLETKLGRTYKAIELLREVNVVDRKGAIEIYKEAGLSESEVDEVIELTHCTPPENYFITSQDMIGKSGVWGHFGIWNFKRATMYNLVYGAEKEESIELLKTEFNMTDQDAQSMYFEIQTVDPDRDANTWIAPWPSYASGVDTCQTREGNTLTCVNNFKINIETGEAEVQTAEGTKHPRRVSVITKEGLITKEYPENYVTLNNGRPIGLAVFPQDTEGDSYATLFMDYELVGGMFSSLYFMDGHGLNCFDKFEDQRSSFGTRIIIWNVDWDCNQNRLIFLQDPPAPTEVIEEPATNESSSNETE